jgi:hypothetical protein
MFSVTQYDETKSSTYKVASQDVSLEKFVSDFVDGERVSDDCSRPSWAGRQLFVIMGNHSSDNNSPFSFTENSSMENTHKMC